MTRTLDTLIQQALMMQELDHAANGNVMVTGWYADLLPDEKELFDNWLSSVITLIDGTFGGFRDRLIQVTDNITRGIAEGFNR